MLQKQNAHTNVSSETGSQLVICTFFFLNFLFILCLLYLFHSLSYISGLSTGHGMHYKYDMDSKKYYYYHVFLYMFVCSFSFCVFLFFFYCVPLSSVFYFLALQDEKILHQLKSLCYCFLALPINIHFFLCLGSGSRDVILASRISSESTNLLLPPPPENFYFILKKNKQQNHQHRTYEKG